MARLPEGSEERLFYMKYIETLFRASCSGFISPPPPPPKCINCPENMSSPNYKPFLERTQTEAAQDMLPKPVGGAAGGGNGAGGGSPARGGNGAGGGAGGGTPGRTKGGTKEAIEEVPNEWRGPLKTQNSLAGAQTAHHPLPLTTPGGKGGTGSSSCEVCCLLSFFSCFLSLNTHASLHVTLPSLSIHHTPACVVQAISLFGILGIGTALLIITALYIRRRLHGGRIGLVKAASKAASKVETKVERPALKSALSPSSPPHSSPPPTVEGKRLEVEPTRMGMTEP